VDPPPPPFGETLTLEQMTEIRTRLALFRLALFRYPEHSEPISLGRIFPSGRVALVRTPCCKAQDDEVHAAIQAALDSPPFRLHTA
jgi:hypothetical protein